MDWVEYIESFNEVSLVLRLVLATVFGGVIGLEREAKRHSAGFRTFTLVCLGSALATVANLYLWEITGATDTARISAGVVSGVGFLGVGTIIVTRKNLVRGLTTAAGLWVTATLGIALGAGMIVIGTLSFVLIMLTMSVLPYFSRRISEHTSVISLYVEIEKEYDTSCLISYARGKGYRIISMEKKKEEISNECDMTVYIELDLGGKMPHSELMKDISMVQGVHYIEEIKY